MFVYRDDLDFDHARAENAGLAAQCLVCSSSGLYEFVVRHRAHPTDEGIAFARRALCYEANSLLPEAYGDLYLIDG